MSARTRGPAANEMLGAAPWAAVHFWQLAGQRRMADVQRPNAVESARYALDVNAAFASASSCATATRVMPKKYFDGSPVRDPAKERQALFVKGPIGSGLKYAAAAFGR